MNESVKGRKKTRQSCASESMDHFTFQFVEELKVKTNNRNIWCFSNMRTVGKVMMEKKATLHVYTHIPCTKKST